MHSIKILSPVNCTAVELRKFKEMVEAGNEVDATNLQRNIERAHLLGFAYEGEEIASIAALKIPNINYKNRIFNKANINNLLVEYDFELGWLYTGKKFRNQGYAKGVMEKLLNSTDVNKVFATVRTDNIPMIKLNEYFRLLPIGDAYITSRENANYELQIFATHSQYTNWKSFLISVITNFWGLLICIKKRIPTRSRFFYTKY